VVTVMGIGVLCGVEAERLVYIQYNA